MRETVAFLTGPGKGLEVVECSETESWLANLAYLTIIVYEMPMKVSHDGGSTVCPVIIYP